MFTDIFSSFDPNIAALSSTLPIQPFWLLRVVAITPLAPTYWLAPSQLTWLVIIPLNIIFHQLSNTARRRLIGWNATVAALFLLLLLLNLIGLAPYVFRLSRHLIFTLTFGLTLWLSLILSSFLNNPIKFLARLLPGGAPLWLNPLLVSIESTSVTVRPTTLSFRLAANMSAGHIVLALIALYAAQAFFSSYWLFLILLTTLVRYLLFEVGICLIQAFIFCLLLSLYSNEHT